MRHVMSSPETKWGKASQKARPFILSFKISSLVFFCFFYKIVLTYWSWYPHAFPILRVYVCTAHTYARNFKGSNWRRLIHPVSTAEGKMNMNFVQQCRHRPPEMGVTRGGPVACRSPSGEPLAVSTMKESLTFFFRRSPSPRARLVGAEPRLHVYHNHIHTGAYIHPTIGMCLV